MPNVHPAAAAVLNYWFGEDEVTGPKMSPCAPQQQTRWFRGSPGMDQEIRTRFRADVEAAAAGKYDSWLESPFNAVAGIILMDQFSRNIYRGTPQMYALDEKALGWCNTLVGSGAWQELTVSMLQFILLPYQHSEKLEVQQRGIALGEMLVKELQAAALGAAEDSPEAACVKQIQSVIRFAQEHERIIAKWGRFPHRNQVLGRESTDEEVEGLANGTIGKF